MLVPKIVLEVTTSAKLRNFAPGNSHFVFICWLVHVSSNFCNCLRHPIFFKISLCFIYDHMRLESIQWHTAIIHKANEQIEINPKGQSDSRGQCSHLVASSNYSKISKQKLIFLKQSSGDIQKISSFHCTGQLWMRSCTCNLENWDMPESREFCPQNSLPAIWYRQGTTSSYSFLRVVCWKPGQWRIWCVLNIFQQRKMLSLLFLHNVFREKDRQQRSRKGDSPSFESCHAWWSFIWYRRVRKSCYEQPTAA